MKNLYLEPDTLSQVTVLDLYSMVLYKYEPLSDDPSFLIIVKKHFAQCGTVKLGVSRTAEQW